MSQKSKSLYFPQIEGLGTTYEAYIAYQFMNKFVHKHKIENVCEFPVCSFRVPGIFGIQLALKGCNVTLASTNEEALEKARALCREYGVSGKVEFARVVRDHLEKEYYDLVFHISLFPTMQKELGLLPFQCLKEMVNLSKRHVIVTNHNFHYSVPLDRFLSGLTKSYPQFGELGLIGAKPVKHMMRNLGLTIRDEFFFDIPPWMAIDLLRIYSRIRMQTTRNIVESNNEAVENEMRKYSFIENSSLPLFFKGFLAHHIAIIAEK